MTKELSKKLCEIVGIKPCLEYNTNFLQVDCYDAGDYVSPFSKQKINIVFKGKQKGRCDFYGYYTKGEWEKVENPKVTSVTKRYPDFGQPENFVKLQETVCNLGMGYNIQLMDISPTLLQIYFCWDEGFNFYIKGNTFQEVYLRYCTQIAELAENIKQAIRSTEWKYE